MSDEAPARIVRYPTEVEVQAAFAAYVGAVGKVAHAWNYLHETLGQLFVALIAAPNSNLSASVWYSPFSDRVQRDMLVAVIEALPAYRWDSLPKNARSDVLRMMHEITELGTKRDDAVHAPASLYVDHENIEMATSFISGHRRAKNLQGKNLLVEFDWCERYAENISRYFRWVIQAMVFAGTPWPKRPQRPDRKLKKRLEGPERPK
jgi:hypothetical protein